METLLATDNVMTEAERLLAEAPVLYDVVSHNGQILFANEKQETALGYKTGALAGSGIEKIYPKGSRKELERLFSEATAGTEIEFVTLALRQRDRSLVDIAANINFFEDANHGLCARLVKFRLGNLIKRLDVIERENEVLSSITETARDATWCIEFVEPVDLTAPDREIIRQVFENACFWRYCNDAMAHLYHLPSDLIFNEQDVRDVFPRNAANESFVQELLDHNFRLDSAPSLDQSYEGDSVTAENDVRAHILHGQLHRMWGTVRDVSRQKRRERALLDQASVALDVLTATPDPIIVIDDELRIEAANPAVEWCFGWPVDKVLGLMLTDFAEFSTSDLHMLKRAGPGKQGCILYAQVICSDGRRLGCDVHAAEITDAGARGRLVLAVRTDTMAAARRSGGAL